MIGQKVVVSFTRAELRAVAHAVRVTLAGPLDDFADDEESCLADAEARITRALHDAGQAPEQKP